MSEFQINERRNWKAQTFPYDHYIPDETEECQYCLTEKQAEILRGIIEPLGWKTRWWSDLDQEIDQDVIEEFRDDIARRLMMSCCGGESPIRYRYTSDGVLQQSTDDGATWQDAPNSDPRNYSPQFPPVSGADGMNKRCLASRGMEQLIKEQIRDQLTDGMSRYTLEQLIKDWVTTYVQTSNPFQALITVITNQIFALVIATLRPTLTDETFTTLQCIFYKRMLSDATFNSAGWELVRSDILSQITGIAGIFLEHLVYLLGVAGLTNLARANGYTGTDDDCSSCDSCTITAYWATGAGAVEYQGGCTWRFTSIVEGINHVVYVWIDNPSSTYDPNSCGKITDISVVSGAIDGFGGYNDCTTGTLHFPVLDIKNVCGSQFYLPSSVPFVVDITFAPC